MNIEVINTAREQRDAPSHSGSYAFRLAGLSGTVGVEGVMHRAELLSPLLSGQRSGESLALDLRYDAERRALDIGVTGSVLGISSAEADQRRDRQSAVLAALLHAQYPGFVPPSQWGE